MTVDGCLSGDNETGAPDDFTVGTLFLWLSEVCYNDCSAAKQSLNSFSDLLMFLSDALLVEIKSGDPEQMLSGLISRFV